RANLSANRAVNIPTETVATGGYFEYQFWNREADALPFKVGSYVGTNDVFNIGAGFYHHGKASGTGSNGVVAETHDHLLFGVDVYMDRVLNKEKNTALTWYSVGYFYDF
ncbi:hypothetical protein RZS08_56470, partial [Arthrospira platensis SPKY1]|nr:hypothetical protein [Arthrospira platensis SPKY1]